MRHILYPLAMMPALLFAQWQQVSVPVSTDLFSIDGLDAQRLCIGTASNWLSSTDGGATWAVNPLVDDLGIELVGSAYYAMEYQTPTTLLGAGITFELTYPFIVRRSTDGGGSWGQAAFAPGDGNFSSYRGMALSGSNGVVVGDLGRVVRTTNSGVSWTLTNSTGATLRDAAWPTASSVVVVGQGRILRSTNSGQTWTTVWTGSNNLYAVSFPTPSLGFASGSGNVLLRTTDGGATWTVLGASLPSGIANFDDLWFTSNTEGFAVAFDLILRTTDGGLHWSYFQGTEALRQLHFQSPTNGYAVGDNGTLYRTGGTGVYRPYAIFAAQNTYCAGSTTTFLNQSGPGLSSEWLVNGEVVGSGTDLPWTFATPGEQLTVTLVVDNGTWTDTLSRQVTVSPTLAITNNAQVLADTLCSGQSTTVQVPGSQSGTSYRLFRGSTAQGAAQNGNGNTLTFPTGSINATQQFHVVATRTVLDCGTAVDSVSFDVVVGNPLATLAISPAAAAVCPGDLLTIGVQDSEALVDYQIRRNGIAVGSAQTGNGGLLEFTVGPLEDNATYTILATNTINGCTSVLQQTVPITVERPLLAWGPTSVNPVVGQPITLMNSSNAFGGSYTWTIPGATPSNSTEVEPQNVVFNAPGTYTVQLVGTTPQGCQDALVRTVQAIDQPEVQDCAVTQLSTFNAAPQHTALALDAQGNHYAFTELGNGQAIKAFSGGTDTLYVDLPSEPDYAYNSVLLKFDTHGIPQWYVDFWNDCSLCKLGDVVVDDDDNVYVAYFHGDFLDSLRVVDASGNITTINPPHASNNRRSVVTTSFTPQGRLRWIATYLEDNNTNRVNLELDGQGHVLVQSSGRMVQYERATGLENWLVEAFYELRDITVLPNDHIITTAMSGMVLREYDNAGNLLQTSPDYEVTPPPQGGPARLTGHEAGRDAAGNIYQIHNIQGQVVFGEDTLTGPGATVSQPDHRYFFTRRGPAGEVVWTRSFDFKHALTLQGMVVDGGRVYVALQFSNGDTLHVEGLAEGLPYGARDAWVISYDFAGGAPHAVQVYDNDGPSIISIPGTNAFVLDPTRTRMALWVGFQDRLVAGLDTAFAHTDWPGPPTSNWRDLGLISGAPECLLPGLPESMLPPQAFFATPTEQCAGQPIAFFDASTSGPTSWNWSFPGGTPATSDQAMPEVTYALPGTYSVTLIATNTFGESAPYTAEVLVDVCTSVAHSDPIRSWQCWPSPASDVLHVRGPADAPARCVDLQGREVWRGTLSAQGSLDVSAWSAGSYILLVGNARIRVQVAH